MDTHDLLGKNLLITGAAGGIGGALARVLRARGANLLLTDLEEVDVSAFPDGPGTIATRSADLSDAAAPARIAAAVASELGGLDGFVNVGAVILRRESLAAVTVADYDLQYAVNLRAPFFLVQELRDLFVDGASLVLFSSQGWWTGGLGGSMPYATTKAGIVAMTRGLARELAPRGIRVNAVAPGFVDTRMMSEGLSVRQQAELVSQVPLGRLATPEEVADAAAMLLLPATSYVTGTVLNVSGGQLIY